MVRKGSRVQVPTTAPYKIMKTINPITLSIGIITLVGGLAMFVYSLLGFQSTSNLALALFVSSIVISMIGVAIVMKLHSRLSMSKKRLVAEVKNFFSELD